MQSRFVRFQGTRQEQLERLRADGWIVLKIKAAPVVVAFQETPDKVFVRMWKGRADKPIYFNGFGTLYFDSLAIAEKNVAFLLKKLKETEEVRAGRRAERRERREALKACDHWAVGDVLYNFWGYDQTNIDWYQVVEVKAKSIVIRAIRRNYQESGFMSGKSQPRRNDFCGQPILKPLSELGRISFRHGGATKWDGRAQGESHYA